jgi:protein-S-isoprenylcysteine O-methyltransferase Ste14
MPRLAIALLYGFVCHTVFALGVGAMIYEMAFGMSRGLGPFTGWAAIVANALLIAQFAAGHSLLLTRPGQRLLERLAPEGHGRTLATTTYATIAAAQIGLLFLLWSPSGEIWWRAEGWLLYVWLGFYGIAWALLGIAMVDAGLSVQSGVLGWWSLARGVPPTFPPMPETGLFRLTRQPIYVTFALTLWTVPTWTPDQLFLAVLLTLYCVLAPLHKERRYALLFGERWQAYRARTPYWLPRLGKATGKV